MLRIRGGRGSKYSNKKTTIAGIKFDSKLEAEHWITLKAREARGEIVGLKRQVWIKLTEKPKGRGRNVFYVPDFVFFDKALGEVVLMDSKGFLTPEYKIKRDWLLEKYTGFVFVELHKKKETIYKPYGEININLF